MNVGDPIGLGPETVKPEGEDELIVDELAEEADEAELGELPHATRMMLTQSPVARHRAVGSGRHRQERALLGAPSERMAASSRNHHKRTDLLLLNGRKAGFGRAAHRDSLVGNYDSDPTEVQGPGERGAGIALTLGGHAKRREVGARFREDVRGGRVDDVRGRIIEFSGVRI